MSLNEKSLRTTQKRLEQAFHQVFYNKVAFDELSVVLAKSEKTHKKLEKAGLRTNFKRESTNEWPKGTAPI